MEHSFKRRRLSVQSGRLTKAYHSHGDVMLSNKDKGSESARPILKKSQPYGSLASLDFFADHLPRSPKKSTSNKTKLSALHPRNFVATNVAGSVQSPTKTVVSSVVQVLVNDGSGAEVTELLVPVKTKVISLAGFAPITLGNNPQPNASSPSTLYETASSTNPAASSNAAQTAQVQASRTPSNTASSSSPASSSPTSIGGAESQSQVILSSPPSTPLPSSPSSSSLSSTGSYFSSSSASASASSSPQSPIAPQTTTGQLSPGFSIGNSTATIPPSTTFSGASTTSQAVFTSNVNSTLVTLTRSSSSETSGGSFTALLSSTSSTNSHASSSSRSAASSQSQTSSSSTASSSLSPSSTAAVIGGGVGGSGGAAGTGSAPSSTASSGAGSGASSGGGATPSTPAVVGGVVGGVAGLAVFLFLLLYLLRRRRAKAQQRAISPPIPQTLPPAAGTGATTERSSVVPFAAGAFLRRMRPGSGQTAATTDTTPSERGFQNMGGRKLESVLSSRGDGYSDPVPTSGVPPRNYGGTAAGLGLAAGAGASRGSGQGPSPGPSEDETLSGSSFYRDSHGFYGGPNEGAAGPSASSYTSPAIPAPAASGIPPQRAEDLSASDRDVVVTRPGPARTPVINEPGFAPMRQPPGTGRGTPPPGAGRGTSPPRALTPQLRQQDDVGRSHPSFDGSRGSRFAEDI